MGRFALVATALLAVSGCRPCLQPGVGDCAALRAVNPAALRANAWLLDDEGFGRRDVPEPGARRAAHLVAAHFQALGLEPGGDQGTFLQEVPITIDEPRKPTLSLVQDDVTIALAAERDFWILEALGDAQVTVDAEVARADENGAAPAGYLRGRVAVVPVVRPGETARAAAAVARLREQGAAGVLLCTRGAQGRDAYHELKQHLERPAVRLAGAPRTTAPAGRLVFALAPPACELLLQTAALGRRPPAGSPVLPLRVRAYATIQPKAGRAWNAVGVYRAARDPAARPVAVMARLDGPGLDVAALLAIGRALVELRARPLRPVVLVAVAGAPGAPVGRTRFEASPQGRHAAHLQVLLRASGDQARVAVARLVEGIVRGAARITPP